MKVVKQKVVMELFQAWWAQIWPHFWLVWLSHEVFACFLKNTRCSRIYPTRHDNTSKVMNLVLDLLTCFLVDLSWLQSQCFKFNKLSGISVVVTCVMIVKLSCIILAERMIRSGKQVLNLLQKKHPPQWMKREHTTKGNIGLWSLVCDYVCSSSKSWMAIKQFWIIWEVCFVYREMQNSGILEFLDYSNG